MPKRVDPEYLDGPIPGMSLTSEPGARPWENPPIYVTVEDVVAFYTEQILDTEAEDFILLTLGKGISVEAAAQHLISSGAMNGVHTMDVGFLVNPVVRELLMYVADSAGITYVESYDKLDKEKRIPRKLAKQIVDEIFAEELKAKEDTETEQEPTGLMARRAAAAMPAAPVTAGVTGEMQPTAAPSSGGLMSGGMM